MWTRVKLSPASIQVVRTTESSRRKAKDKKELAKSSDQDEDTEMAKVYLEMSRLFEQRQGGMEDRKFS
jgi:hypothetical protein